MKSRFLRGFTLIEVTIAIGLLAFMLMAIIGLMSLGLDSSKAAQIATVETTAARMIQAAIHTNTPATLTGGIYYINYDGSTNAGSGGAFFQCVVTVNQPVANLPASDFAGVKMEFSYPLAASAANRTTNVFHAGISR